MRTYKTFAIINVENDSLVILGRCSKEQLERMCEEMNATQGRSAQRVFNYTTHELQKSIAKMYKLCRKTIPKLCTI